MAPEFRAARAGRANKSGFVTTGGVGFLVSLVGLLVSGSSEAGIGQEGPTEPVVHAILFYSPTCPHCHQVITEELIPLQERYGNRLVLLGFDTSQTWANDLFWEAIQHFEVPEDRWAVPFLVVGDQVLIGALEIPARFSSMIESALAADGIDLPEIPGMVTFLREQGILDPRYPGRRIAVQAQAGESPEERSDSAGEPPAGAETVPTDTALADSLVQPPEEPAADSSELQEEGQEGEQTDTARAAAEPSPGDSLPAPVREPVVVQEDSGGVAPAEGEPAAAAGEGTPDTMSAEPEPATPEARPGREAPGVDSALIPEVGREIPATGAGEETTPAGAPLGLEAAARELESMTMMDRFSLDPVGNSLSVAVLLLMLLALLYRGYPPRARGEAWPDLLILVLLIVGAVVAAYLSYVEVTGSRAVCGPVGDCNTVQQSPYARLFGVLPVGVLGLIGYGLMFLLWVTGKLGSDQLKRASWLLIWVGAFLGTLFSIYLTFLEPFVIGATCAWCLTSAVVMTLVLVGTAPLATRAWPGREAVSA